MQAPSQIGPPAAAILDSHSGGVIILELCETGNLLFVLSAEERRAVLKLLWGLVIISIISGSRVAIIQ